MRIHHAACVLAALTAPSAALAQDPPDVATLISDARAAHVAVQSAHYFGHFELKIEGRPETYTRDGEVWFVRHPPPTPPPPPPPADEEGVIPAIPLVGPRSEIGANVRIELDDGGVTAFDGETVYMLMPQVQKLMTATLAVGGERLITGNITGNLIETPLLQADRLPAPPEGELSYVGEETIEGVDCHIIEFRAPDDEMLSNQFETFWLGKDDLLMRKRDMKYTIGGNRQHEWWIISDLEVGVAIDEGLFTVEAPEDFEVEEYQPEPPPELLAVGDAAPAWTLTDADGNEHSLSDYSGRIVVLDFWGTWCAPCLQAMPAIQGVHEKFRDRGVAVIGVSCNEREGADPARLMQEKGYTYGLLLNGERIVEAYHVSAYPTMYIIDQDGTIAASHVGAGPGLEKVLTEKLNELLDE